MNLVIGETSFCHIAARCYASVAYAVPSVLLSVCLSVTFLHSVKTSNRIFIFFSTSSSQIILVFPYHMSWQYSDEDLSNGGVECRWGKHKPQLSTNSCLSIDDCCSVRSTIDGRRCSSVSQLRCTYVYGTKTATHQWIRRREQNRIYLYAAVNLKPK